MAGRGRARKDAGAVADERNGKAIVERELTVTIPAKPRGMPAAVRRAWEDFWASDVAVLLQRSDLHAVRRLFELYVERETCHHHVTTTFRTRVPLLDALKVGLVGELEYEHTDDGEAKVFVVLEHEGRVAIGSQGQLVQSAWDKDLRVIDSEIRQLEDRFGLSIRARAALAVAVRAPAGPPADAPAPAPAAGPSEADRDLLDL